MTLLTLIKILRIVFLLSLGVDLLIGNKYCRVAAGVTSLILGIFVLTGNF